MMSRIRPWASLLWVWTEAVLRSNPSWIWMHVILLSIPMWLWIEEVCGPNPLCMWTEEMLASDSGPSPVVTSPESQRVVTEPPLDRTGDMERPREGDLTRLPDDLVEAILGNLSLHELARVSTTCSAFQALCRRQVAQEQNTRCDLAVRCVGRERLVYVAFIIDRFVKGEPVGPELAEKGNDAEWVLVREIVYGKSSDRRYNAGDMEVNVKSGFFFGDSLGVKLPTLNGITKQIYIRVCISPDALSIDLANMCDEEAFDVTQGMAIMHTLLSGDLAPPFREPGLPSGACTVRYLFVNHLPEEKLKVLGATWMSMPSRHSFAAVGLGGARFRHERVRVSQAGYNVQVGPSLSSSKRLYLWMAVYSTETFSAYIVRRYFQLMKDLSKFFD